MPRPICPCCQRPFRGIMDFPRVRLLTFERLPIPEAVDTMSEAAAEKWLARRRKAAPNDLHGFQSDGINMTPVIEQACNSEWVIDYLQRLSSLVGKTVKPAGLLPPKPHHRIFKWAHPIPDTKLFLSLGDADDEPTKSAEVQIHCDGPNLGSAGGPTLQRLGPIARVGFKGLLRLSSRR